ncbi:MAG: hypothetical protein JWO38_3472 [Gemmataceae bacterium]|nr:hypothetical protein [Gemmataceae bacterium]
MISPMRTRRFSAVFLAAVVLGPAAVSAPPDDPFKPVEKKDVKPARIATPPAGKPADPDDPFAPGANLKAAPGKAGWGEGSVAVPFEPGAAVTFGPVGCPVAVVGLTVWDLKANKAVRKLAGPYEARGLRALSADGKYFAAGSKSPNQQDTAVAVWSTETGQRVLDVPGDKKALVDLLAISRNKYLLLGGRHNTQIDVWDVETGKVVKQLTVPDRRVESDKLAFTPDGKYFACIAHDKIVVTETATNKEVAVTEPPGPGVPADPPAGPKGVVPKRSARFDAIFVFAWTRGLAFSPDGTELAAFSTHPSPRLLVWNTKGELVTDEPVPMPRTISHRNTLEWLPDGSGWLVNGYLFDRASKRVVVSIRVPFASDVLPHLLDKDRVIGVFGEDRGRLQTVTIPWEKLNVSLKQMTAKAPSYLAPGEPVSVALELAGLRGDEADTRKILTDALTRRLARDGIPVGEGKSTVLRLKLAEEAGESLPIYERQSPFDFRGKDTGRKATEVKGAAVLELVAKGEDQPLWRGQLTAFSARSFKEEITDLAVRKSMLEHLGRQLSGMDMPYFIPKSKDVVALPAVVE